MEENTENTNVETTADQQTGPSSKGKTVQFSARIYETEANILKQQIEPFETKAEGMRELIKRLHPVEWKAPEPKIIEVEKPLPEGAYLLNFKPELKEKLTNLRRVLKQRGDIPQESTEQEFLERLTIKALEKFISQNYNFINRS